MGAILQNDGTLVGELLRYEPFGDARGTQPGSAITDRGFTGHRENRDIGLTYMNARYYVGENGRFASADTLVPDPMDPQSFNRYSCGYNNPIRYGDPSGHKVEDTNDGCVHAATSGECFYEPVNFVETPLVNTAADDPRFATVSAVVCTTSGTCRAKHLNHVYTAKPGLEAGTGAKNAYLAEQLGILGAINDMFATGVSATGVVFQGIAFAGGGPGLDDVIANGAYLTLLDPVENAVSVFGYAAVTGADYFGGYTYLNSQEAVLGQDISVLAVSTALGQVAGAVPILGPTLDTAINLGVNAYDLRYTLMQNPKEFEVRLSASDRFVLWFR